MRPDPSSAALLHRFIDALPVAGGSVTVIALSGASSTVIVDDEIAARLDALQLDLDEGPRLQAFRSRSAVLVPDVRDETATAEWPVFGAAAGSSGASGVFAFPLMVGAAPVGAVDLYSTSPGPAWSKQQVASGRMLAAAAARPAVDLAARSASASRSTLPAFAPELRREVHQATGMLIVQLGIAPEDALAVLRARAFATGRPLLDIARDIVGRRIDGSAFFG